VLSSDERENFATIRAGELRSLGFIHITSTSTSHLFRNSTKGITASLHHCYVSFMDHDLPFIFRLTVSFPFQDISAVVLRAAEPPAMSDFDDVAPQQSAPRRAAAQIIRVRLLPTGSQRSVPVAVWQSGGF
jgi:hypothetical protein